MTGELVLVIDDQVESREFILNHVLIPGGYRHLAVEDGREGLQRAIDTHPDVILLSFSSAGLSALRVLQSLKERGRSPPVILITSQESESLILQAFRLGAREYVSRPLDADTVLAAIEQILNESRSLWERDRRQERLQHRTQEQKVLYSVGQAITSQLNLQQVLSQLVEVATYITDADASSLLLKDPDTEELRLRVYQGEGEPHARAVNHVIRDRLAQRVLDSGAPLSLAGQDAVAARAPVPVLLDMPLKIQEEPIGLLRVVRFHEQKAFTKDNIYQLGILATYAALSVHGATLSTEIEEKVERAAISQIGAALGSTLHLDSVLEMVMQVAVRLVNAERGCVVLVDEQSGGYVPRVTYALPLETYDEAEFQDERHIVRLVIEEGEPILTVLECATEEGAGDVPIRSVLCVPISGASRVVGAIYVDQCRQGRYFERVHQDMLTSLAFHAAAAIENAKLFHRAEAERRKLEAVIRGTDQPVIVTDTEGTVLLMNSAARRVLNTGRGTGFLFPQVTAHPALAALLSQAKASERVQHYEIVAGENRTYNVAVTPIPQVGFVMVMQDITEFKQLSRMKSEFVATVSHDLRSPLSTVLGLLSVLDQAGPINEQQREFVVGAQQEVAHLLNLTSDLLDLGRLESDTELEMEPCDMREIVVQALDNGQGQVEEKHHALEVDLPSEPMLVRGSARWLRRVVDNLLNNAVKYTLRGGWISVYLAREGTEVILQVKDSGVGIAPQDQPCVFDRFFRGRNDLVRDVEGTGLGLAIVKSTVERHRGRVWLESELGKGSTFGVALPGLNGG